MSYPDVMHLPAWVFWLAQDEGGAWWGYEAEPLQFHNGWYENEVGRRLRVAVGETNASWRATLCRVR